MVILPLPIEQCHAVVESLGLTYPLYADPTWSVFEQYTTGHILYAPKQSWVSVDAGGTVSYVWRQGGDGGIGRVPLGPEVLDAVAP